MLRQKVVQMRCCSRLDVPLRTADAAGVHLHMHLHHCACADSSAAASVVWEASKQLPASVEIPEGVERQVSLGHSAGSADVQQQPATPDCSNMVGRPADASCQCSWLPLLFCCSTGPWQVAQPILHLEPCWPECVSGALAGRNPAHASTFSMAWLHGHSAHASKDGGTCTNPAHVLHLVEG